MPLAPEGSRARRSKMDDEQQIVECQLELMHALQNRPSLRLVKEEDRPAWIGGRKTGELPAEQRLSALQSEFLASSLTMQTRLRPRLENMEEIRRSSMQDDAWRSIQHDLREATRQPRSLGWREGEPRLLYQLERTIEDQPGWRKLQQEVRGTDPHQILQPIDFDGFYIIHPCMGETSHPADDSSQPDNLI